MSEKLEMEELKIWLADPATKKFMRVVRKFRERLLEEMSGHYQDQKLTLAGFGGCEALKRVADYIDEGGKKENLEEMLNVYYYDQYKPLEVVEVKDEEK